MLNTRQVSKKKKTRSNARDFPALECRGSSSCDWNTQRKGRQDRLRPYSFTNSISWQRLPSTLVRKKKKTVLQCRESAELDVCIVWNPPLIYPNYRQIYLDLPYLKKWTPILFRCILLKDAFISKVSILQDFPPIQNHDSCVHRTWISVWHRREHLSSIHTHVWLHHHQGSDKGLCITSPIVSQMIQTLKWI